MRPLNSHTELGLPVNPPNNQFSEFICFLLTLSSYVSFNKLYYRDFTHYSIFVFLQMRS